MSNAEVIFDNFSYRDYKGWDDSVRYELINGEAFMMSAPDERHHDLVTDIYTQLRDQLSGSPCKPFIAPFDVRLFPREDESDDTVVQPDVFVVCDRNKLLDGKACKGAPDFVVEVTSPSSKIIDLFNQHTPPQSSEVCCSHKVLDSGFIPDDRPKGAGYETLATNHHTHEVLCLIHTAPFT